MAWGDPGVSKKLRLSNGISTPGTGGMPTSVAVQQTGILSKLTLLVSGATTATPGTGTIARDVLGPWNLFTQVSLAPNQQSPVVQLSGYGLYLANLMRAAEQGGNYPLTPDTVAVSETSAVASTDIYNASATTSQSAWRFYEHIPVTQVLRTIGEVGFWPLQNPAMQLNLSYTLNSSSSATPYNIYSTTAGQSPYLVTGNATMTLAAPQIDVMRTLYQVPASQGNFPPFNLVSTMIEESPQGANISGATTFTWQATPLSGILARIGLFIFDGNANAGVANSTLNLSNSLQLTYDADTVKFSESSYEALQRMHSLYTFGMPQGFFTWDLLGSELTLADTLNTNTTANIKIKVNAASAFGSNSYAKVIRQIISPLEVK